MARPRPEQIEAVSQWIVAPGGIGHAVRSREPTTAYCGKAGFTGGFFTPRPPKRICRECAESIGLGIAAGRPTLPEPGGPPAPPEVQGSLF